MKHDTILSTIGRTPVVRLNKRGRRDVNVFMKLESFNPMGSVKDRMALATIEAAEQSGQLRPGQTAVPWSLLHLPVCYDEYPGQHGEQNCEKHCARAEILRESRQVMTLEADPVYDNFDCRIEQFDDHYEEHAAEQQRPLSACASEPQRGRQQHASGPRFLAKSRLTSIAVSEPAQRVERRQP